MPNDIDWNNQDIDENDGLDNQGGEPNVVKTLRGLHKEDSKKISELESQLEKLLSKDREKTVKEVLEKKGVNPKAAKLVLKDVTEVTEENVEAWLTDNAELFNLTVKPSDAPAEGEGEPEGSGELGRQDALTSQANTPGTGGDINAKLQSFKTFEEIQAWAESQQK